MAFYHSPYFPARNLLKQSTDGGAWLVAYKEEQRKRFNAVLCPMTKEEYKSEPHKPSKTKKSVKSSPFKNVEDHPVLDGHFLLNHAKLDDPSEITSINIIGENLQLGKWEDFVLFDNVAQIKAGENNLDLDAFKTFPTLCELELQLNGISSLNLTPSDFKYLKSLDLSFNSLSPPELLCLGTLASLKCLYLTGNYLKVLPTEMAKKQKHSSKRQNSNKRRFQSLEVLYLDENDFEDMSVFASLASLPKLKELNLAKNKLQFVPQLRLMALNLNKNHVLPTAGYLEKVPPEMHGTTGETNNLPDNKNIESKENYGGLDDDTDPKPPEEVLEGTPLNDHSSEEEKGILHNAEEEVKGLEHDWTPENIPDPNFQFEEDAEDGDTALGLDFKEEGLDGDEHVEWSGDSLDFDLSFHALECPFPCLEKINLTYNLFSEDQALLPLATWPSLVEVDIWKNPLVKNRVGISSFLHYHLTVLCGIKINRKEPRKTHRPAVGRAIVPVALHNKVDDILPPLRRKNMLLLEFEKYEASLQNDALTGPRLPSISSGNDENIPRSSHSAPVRQSSINLGANIDHRSKSAVNLLDSENQSQRGSASGSDDIGRDFQVEDDQSGVFLTQVDAIDEESQIPAVDEQDVGQLNRENVDAEAIASSEEERQYEAIEDLLKTDDFVEMYDVPPETNVPANVKALRLALDNPLVFNESTKLPTEIKYKRPSQSRSVFSSRKTRQGQILSTLDDMKQQSNMVEENLDVVLKNYKKDINLKQQFPNVKGLLKDIQLKYDKVRLASLDSSSNAHKLIQSSIGKPHDNHHHKHSLSNSQKKVERSREAEDISGWKYSSIQADSSNSASKNLEKFREAVNSRI